MRFNVLLCQQLLAIEVKLTYSYYSVTRSNHQFCRNATITSLKSFDTAGGTTTASLKTGPSGETL